MANLGRPIQTIMTLNMKAGCRLYIKQIMNDNNNNNFGILSFKSPEYSLRMKLIEIQLVFSLDFCLVNFYSIVDY